MRLFGQTLKVLLTLMLVATTSVAFDFSEIENKIVEHKLDNGLTILIMPRHDAPVVSFVTTVNVGCAEDPMGSMGMAHMFEHMAFKGTHNIGSKDIKKEEKWMAEEDRIFDMILDERAKGDGADSAYLEELGVRMKTASDSAFEYSESNEFDIIVESNGGVGLNAGTSYDRTSYYVSFPSNRLEIWMSMESERFLDPVLRDLFREKQVVAEERRYRLESSPTGRMFFAEYPGIAYNAHPYGKTMIGEMSEIQDYNRPTMMEHFHNYYVPSNMAIGIVGDVDPDKVIKLADKYFGRLKDRPQPREVDIKEAEPFGVRQATISEKSQPMFVTGFHIPSQIHPDWLAIDALSSYLGSGRTSVLYKKLVKENKSAVEVQAFVGYPGSKYPSMFSVFCMPSNESSNSENEEVVLAEIEKARTELIPEKELEKIKAQAKASKINGLSSNTGLAAQLADYELTYGDWRELFRELDKINALTAEDLKRVAEEYLDTEKRVVVYLEKPEE